MRRRRRRGVAMATGGRDDGGRENVEKEEERRQEEDETETPVDRQLQRRHDLSLSRVNKFLLSSGKVKKRRKRGKVF